MHSYHTCTMAPATYLPALGQVGYGRTQVVLTAVLRPGERPLRLTTERHPIASWVGTTVHLK